MTGWNEFIYFATVAIAFWVIGATLSIVSTIKGSVVLKRISLVVYSFGLLLFGLFIALYWISIGHTPMRSMAETRVWYSFFISLFGVVIFAKYPYPFVLPFTSIMASVFSILNIVKPELQSQGLPPALQSGWFLPHVSIYMIAYAITAIALIFGVVSLVDKKNSDSYIKISDLLTGMASMFLLAGMLCGAVWAKEAWGDWWAWDAKENWAAATWFLSLLCLHLRIFYKRKRLLRVAVLLLTFVFLQVTWYGVDKLPAAHDSMHTYSVNN